MTKRVVITEKRHPEDIPDEFYFSSPKNFGGVLRWETMS